MARPWERTLGGTVRKGKKKGGAKGRCKRGRCIGQEGVSRQGKAGNVRIWERVRQRVVGVGRMGGKCRGGRLVVLIQE